MIISNNDKDKYLHVKKQINTIYHKSEEVHMRERWDCEAENEGYLAQLILNSSSVDTYVWISPSLIRRSIDGKT